MILADYIMIFIILGMGITGFLIGFGRGIKILTGGIVGIIISIINCYFLFGLVSHIKFVESFMQIIVNGCMNASNWFCDFLLLIRIEMIVVSVLLFIIVTVIRKIMVHILANIVETDHMVIKTINKSLGAVLGVVSFIVVALIIMQVTLMIKGDGSLLMNYFKGSFFHLDEIYMNNPLEVIIKNFLRR